ncbi:MAG TPA: hypothetical protein ENJ07_05435 [Gammaproteobacteria bacterium]|nr:hypothetical protein [Gammaproteobacteria bacterium]
MSIDDLFNDTPSTPKVWVERVALHESIELAVFQEIPLTPGLNIIWAEEGKQDKRKGELGLLGHGVGKTSFCRLLRYCLGEKHYAPKRFRERIVEAYPDGYVAASVWIDDNKWEVARPFDARKKSYFAKGCDFSNLFVSEQLLSKDEYIDALSHCVFGASDSLILPGSGQVITWEHLLSWCTRDQEAHLDNFSVWRAPRSESESPSFKWPSKDPIELVRFCLGYVEADEQRLQVQCQRLENEIETLKKEVDGLALQPQFFHDEIASRLRKTLNVSGLVPVSSDNVDLFTPSSLLEMAKSRLKKKRDKIEKEKERLLLLDDQRLGANAKMSSISDEIGRLETAVNINESQKVKIEKGLKEHKELEETINNPKEFCKYGNTPLEKCKHLIEYRTYFQFGTKRQKNESEAIYQNRLAIIRDHNKRIEGEKKALSDMQKEFDDVSRQYSGCDWAIKTLDIEATALEKDISELRKYDDILAGRNEDAILVKMIAKLEEKEKSLKGKQDSLKLVKSNQIDKASSINTYLNKLAENVYPDLQGRAMLGDAARPFQLLGPGGEAFHALEVILGDLSAALFATHQPIIHPGFIIHDSPREADMGDNLYRGYFRMLIKMGKAMQKKNCYPIQYIVATTTMPLDGEGEEEFIRHRLHATSEDGLLFKRHLHEVGEGLFSESSSKGESP